ncbi:MAG: hypothetical protein AXW12_19920 [Thalassospira sp. Nap_22]|nr:MAG: hypothetical protein AXW12_19920 [Thalassospira sp. Nap_22]
MAGAREDADWASLTAARNVVVSRASVPEVTARKWMSLVESGHQPVSAPENAKIVEKIRGWAGEEATNDWLNSYRNFSESSLRVHRAGLELADHAGLDARLDLEGLRDDGPLRQRLVAIAARINPTLDVHLPKELFMEGPGLIASGLKSTSRTEIAGMYEPYKHLATISVSPRFDQEDTAWHEAWHSIEPVLNTREKAALAKAFPDNSHMISTERVAVAFARWAKLRDRIPAGTAKEAALSSKLCQALMPAGREAIQSIFEKAYDGTFGQRMIKAMAQTQPAFLQKIQSGPQAIAAKTPVSEAPSPRPTQSRPQKARRMRR